MERMRSGDDSGETAQGSLPASPTEPEQIPVPNEEGMPFPEDGSEAGDIEQEQAPITEKSVDDVPLDGQEKRFVLSNLKNIRTGAFATTENALAQMEGIYPDFRHRSWEQRFAKWIEEKLTHIQDSIEIMAEGGIFASLGKWILDKLYKGKDEVSNDVERRRRAKIGISGHLMVMKVLMENIDKQFIAAESAQTRGELEEAMVRIQFLTRTLSEGLEDIQRFKRETNHGTNNTDVGGDLDEVMSDYDQSTAGLKEQLVNAVGRIKETMTFSDKGERVIEIRERILKGVASVDDYKEFLNSSDLAAFELREVIVRFNDNPEMSNIKMLNELLLDPYLPLNQEIRKSLFTATEAALSIRDGYDISTGEPKPELDQKIRDIKLLLVDATDQIREYLTQPISGDTKQPEEELLEAA